MSKVVGNYSKLKNLYGQLKDVASDIDWGSEDEFMQGLSDASNREWLHQTLSDRGMFSQDYDLDTFNKKLGFGVVNLGDDTETGNGPVKPVQEKPDQWRDPMGNKVQYRPEEPKQEEQLPRTPIYPEQNVLPKPDMPMYQGYESKPMQFGPQQEQDASKQPINTAAPLTEEAGAEVGAKIREGFETRAKHEQAIHDINKVYNSGEEIRQMTDPYDEKIEEIKQDNGLQLENDRMEKIKANEMDRQREAAAAYVWDYLVKDKFEGTSGKMTSSLSVYSNLAQAKSTSDYESIFDRLNGTLNDDVIDAYARTAYGINGKMDFVTRQSIHRELEGLMTGKVLDKIVSMKSDALNGDKFAFFKEKVRSSILPAQLQGIVTNWFGTDTDKMMRQIEDESIARSEHKYDETFGGKLLTNSAAGTAFAFNMMAIGGIMNKGIAGALGRWTPQAASGLWALGQAGVKWAVWDSMVNNAYWNGAMRGTAALASQYVGFGRLGAINTGLAMLSDPNLVNRYGNLSSASGWFSELGCDAKKIIDAYTEEGETGFKFGLLNMVTAGITNNIRSNVFKKSLKDGKTVYEASRDAVKSGKAAAAKAAGVAGELGFFTLQSIDHINEENKNNPDMQIGLTDYEKWAGEVVKQIGFLGALKMVNAGHGTQDQYKMIYEQGRKFASTGQTLLDKTNLNLNKDDLMSLEQAGLGRHKDFSFDLVNALMQRVPNTNLTVYEKMMRDHELPTVTLYKLKVGMEHKISNMGYTCDNYGAVVGSLSPMDFVVKNAVYKSAANDGKYSVYSFGKNSEVVDIKTFATREDADSYAKKCDDMAAMNNMRLMESQIGDTRTTVKDVIHGWADRNGISHKDAEDLYNDYLDNREKAAPSSIEMAESVKAEMWRLINKNRAQAIAKNRQLVKDITGIDMNDIIGKDPSSLTSDERAALDTYNQMLWTTKRIATTDPDILAVEEALDPATGMVREGVTRDGREVTVKGQGDAVVVTEKADPNTGKPAGKPEMVSKNDVTITSETPAEDLIEQINEKRAAEEVKAGENDSEPVAEVAPEPAKVEETPVGEAPVEEEEPIRKVRAYDADRGEWYDGEDVGNGMGIGTRRVRLSDGRMIDADSRDLQYMPEEVKTEEPAPATTPVAEVAPEPAPAPEPVSEEGGVKIDAKGMPTMENDPRVTASYLMNDPELEGMGEQIIAQRQAAANKAYEASLKKKANIGSDGDIMRIKRENAAIKAEQERLKAEADYWNETKSQADAIKKQKDQQAKDEQMMEGRAGQTAGSKLTRRIEKVMNELGDPSTVREAVLMDFLKPGGFGLSKEDIVKELGAAGENITAEGLRYQLARGERKALGNTIQSVAEGIASEHGWDVQKVRDEIIDVLTSFSGDKSKAVEELEKIADVTSGRRGQYTAEEAENMRQMAIEEGEDLNAPVKVEPVPEELRSSSTVAPFDIEEGDASRKVEDNTEVKNDSEPDPLDVPAPVNERMAEHVENLNSMAKVNLNGKDGFEKLYRLNGELAKAQGAAIDDAISIIGGSMEEGNMHPMFQQDPNAVAGKDDQGNDVYQRDIYKRQQERLKPIYKAYIESIEKQIGKVRSEEMREQLKMLKENVEKRMAQVDKTIEPNYDPNEAYWSKDLAFDIENPTSIDSEAGVRKAIDALLMDNSLSPEEANARIEALMKRGTFLRDLNRMKTKTDYDDLVKRILEDESLSLDERAEQVSELNNKWQAVQASEYKKASAASDMDHNLLKRMADATGISIIADADKFPSSNVNGFYDRKNKTLYINPKGNRMGNLTGVLSHEVLHALEETEGYQDLAKSLLDLAYDGDATEAIDKIQKLYNDHFQKMYDEGKASFVDHLDRTGAKKEVVANVLKDVIFKGAEGAKRLDQAIERMNDQSMAGRFCAKLRDMYDLATTAWNKSWEEAISKKELMDARDHFADLAIKYKEIENKEAMKRKMLSDNRGDEVAYVDADNNIQMTLSTYDGYTDNLGFYHEGTRARMASYFDDKIAAGLMKTEDKQQMLQKMDYWYDYMSKVADFMNEDGTIRFKAFKEWNRRQPAYRLIGKDIEEKVLSTIVQNGEYPVNLELTTDCIKRETFTQLLNKIVQMNPKSLKNLNPKEITIIQDVMKSYGIQTACPLCFVEGKRLMIRNWAQSIADSYNVALAEVVENSDLADGWKPIIKEVTETVDGVKKTRRYVENIDEMEEVLGALGFASDDAVSEETWDMVKARNNTSEQKEYHRRINSTFELMSGRKGGVMDDDMRDLEAGAKAAADKMFEMEAQWRQDHPDEEDWEMTADQQKEINDLLMAGKDKVFQKMKAAVLQYPELRKVLKPEDMLGSTGLDNLRSLGDAAHRRLFSLMLSSFGAGTPKVVQRAEPYAGEILERSMDSAVEKARKVGGGRLFSFSDFDITKTFDIMQIFWDEEARKAKLQSYSKEVPYILFFGRNTNAKINMSTLVEVRPMAAFLEAYKIAPLSSKDPNKKTKAQIKKQIEEYAGLELDENGKIIGMTWSNSHSVSPKFAQEIFKDPDYNANCGATTVGVSVNHTLYSMMTPWIRQVIPFHLSGMPIAARERTDVGWYRDATKDQNTCVKNAKGEWVSIHGKWAKDNLRDKKGNKIEDFDFYEGEEKEDWDMRIRCAMYAEWCKKNGFRPKFEWAMNADNYVAWCKDNGYKPNAQIESEMRAHETERNGIKVYDNYYKVICDFNPYKPIFDSEGKYIGDEKAPHKPIKGDFVQDQRMLDLMFGADNSMLANREANIQHGTNMITKLANDIIGYLYGDKTKSEIMSKNPDAFRNTEDADLYLNSRRNQQFNIEESEPAGHIRSRNFKRWFGDWEKDPEHASKVVGEDGKPMVVYHYTNGKEIVNKKTGQKYDDLDWKEKDYWNNEASDEEWNNTWEERDFDAFDTSKARRSVEVPGIFFSPSPTETRDFGKRRIAAYINLKNPIYDPKPREMGFDMGTTDDMGERFMNHLRKLGYDGIINTEDGEVYEVVAFDPEQVKSVDNRGTFDPKDKRFQYDVEPEDGVETTEPAGEPAGTVVDAKRSEIKNVGYTEADVDRRIAELNNQQREQTSSMTNIGGKPRQMPDGTFSPDVTGAAGVSAGAKVSKKLRNSEDIEKEAANFQRELDFIKNGGTDKGLVTRVRMFVRNRLNLATGTGLGPAGINNLMDQLDKVRDAKEVEPILHQIQFVLNRAELKTEMDEMLKMLNTKTQSQTTKGLAKGIGVDSQTNQVLEDIRGSFRQMVATDIVEKKREVNRQIRDLKEEYGVQKVEEGNEEFQAKYRALRDQYTSLVEQQAEAEKLHAQETEEQLAGRHEQILNEMNDYREQGKEIPKTLIEERIALPIRQQLAQLRAMTGTMDELEKELQDARDNLVGMKGEERKTQKQLIADKQKALINWQRRCVLMSKQIKEDLHDLLTEGRSKRAEAVKKQIEEENLLVQAALDAVQKEKVNPRNQPVGMKSGDEEWTTSDKFVASLQESWEGKKEKLRNLSHKYNAPVYSFNYLLKYLDKNHGQGDGDLYRMLMKDEGGAVEANDNYAEGLTQFGNAVNEKSQELFGMSFDELMKDSKKRTYKTIYVEQELEDGRRWIKPVELTKGQALYIWLTSRQQAGAEKLAGDGWVGERLKDLEDLMGPEYKKFGEWITDEFLPQLRADKYNPTYEKMYGTSMHMASHYFPIKIWDKVVHEKGEVGEQFEGMPSSATGNLVMRTSNKLPIDTEVNALEMLMKYGKDMERWNAMSGITQKLNVLLHSNAFRNRIIANEGEDMWQIWKDACMVVTNSYQSKETNATGELMSKLQNSFMKNAIGFRWYTAMKQTLSYPAFSAYTGDLAFQAELLANIGRTFGTRKSDAWHESNFNWAMENLPGFRQRVAASDMGIEGLNDDGLGGTAERKWSEWGMAANKWVDARTVAAGARAVYNYEYKQGLKRGLSEKEARRLAVINAEICFNESQQSSRPEFSSPTQKNRDLLSRSTVAFQNSNISYRRGVLEGLHDVMNAYRVYKVRVGDESIQSQEEIEAAKAERNKQYARGMRKMLNFGALLPGLWYWGSNISTSWANTEEDEEKDRYTVNMIANIAMGFLTNGSSVGTMVQTLYNTVYKVLTGDSQSATADLNPMQSYALLAEIVTDALKTYKEDEKTEGGIGVRGYAEGMANWAMRMFGINPETWTNIYIGIADAVRRGRPELQDAMFILNVPGSQRKAIVDRMAREDTPSDFMRQVEEAGKLYEEGDNRYGKLLMGTKLLTDKKREELLKSYVDAKLPEFNTLMDDIKAFEKASKDRYEEMKAGMIERGETGIDELIKLDAMEEVANSGEFNIDLNSYKRYKNNLVRDGLGNLEMHEENTLEGKVMNTQTLKQKYDNIIKAAKKAAETVEEHPEEFDKLIYELESVEKMILREFGRYE